jgi:hypothetical protein
MRCIKNYDSKAALSDEGAAVVKAAAAKSEHTRPEKSWIFGSRLRTWKSDCFSEAYSKVIPLFHHCSRQMSDRIAVHQSSEFIRADCPTPS